jgi:hypothetical protein
MATVTPSATTLLINNGDNIRQKKRSFIYDNKWLILLFLINIPFAIYALVQIANSNSLGSLVEVSMYKFVQYDANCTVNIPYIPPKNVSCNKLNITLVSSNSTIYYLADYCIDYVNPFINIQRCKVLIPQIQHYIADKTKFRFNTKTSELTKYKPVSTTMVAIAWISSIISIVSFIVLLLLFLDKP